MRRQEFDNYVEWLGIVYAITLGLLPGAVAALRLHRVRPAGRRCKWWRRPRAEAQLLAGAKVLEDILGVRGTTPIDPRPPR